MRPTQNGMPESPLPDPLRALEVGTFTHHSVVNRLPEIARRVLDENSLAPETVAKIEGLAEGIPLDPIRPLQTPGAPDAGAWRGYVTPFEGQTWLQVPWFFAETYFYRRILEATGYFAPGEGWGTDPFQLQKSRGLERIQSLMDLSQPELSGSNKGTEQTNWLEQALEGALWGNQADLSLWPVSTEQPDVQPDGQGTSDMQLVDESGAVLQHLQTRRESRMRVDLILDNAGEELLRDLELAAGLLNGGASEVRLHVKQHPTFVSDAMTKDALQLIVLLEASDMKYWREFASQLLRWLRSSRLRLVTHPYWTSPLAFRDLPLDLWRELQASDLLILKGDANYRRLVGDRHWTFDHPLEQAAGPLPAPLVALRTLKSEVAAGIPSAEVARAQEVDPEWMINGRWGLIQAVGLAPVDPPNSGG